MTDSKEAIAHNNALERHAQTTIVLIIVALLVWVGSTTQKTQVTIAQLEVKVNALQKVVQEPDNKFAAIESRLDRIEKQLATIQRDQTP